MGLLNITVFQFSPQKIKIRKQLQQKKSNKKDCDNIIEDNRK